MIVDLKNFSEQERNLLLLEAGYRLQHVEFPDTHPDRPSSRFFYEINVAEDVLETARRKRVEKQQRQKKKKFAKKPTKRKKNDSKKR